MKIYNLKNIPTTSGHNSSVYKKQLIKFSDRNESLATFNYAWLKKGMTLDPHTHPDGEEFYLFLKGKGRMLLGDTWHDVSENDFVEVPQNCIHSLTNEGEEDLVFTTLRTIK